MTESSYTHLSRRGCASTARIRLVIFSGLLITVMLAGCGSRPVRQPTVVVNSDADMALGMRAYQDNNYSEARNYFSRALAQYRSVDDHTGQLRALIDLTDSALGQGEYAAARDYLDAADTIAADGNHSSLKPHLVLLGTYADMQAGDNQQAADQLDTLLKDGSTPADIRQAALFARTQTAFDLKSSDAAAWLNKLGAALGNSMDTLNQARYRRLQALAALSNGNHEQAAVLYAQALDVYRTAYYRPGIAATLEEWAALSMQQKDWVNARQQLQRALDVRLSMYDRTHSIRDLENLAQAETALGGTAAAQRSSQLADYLRNGGDPAQLPSGESKAQ